MSSKFKTKTKNPKGKKEKFLLNSNLNAKKKDFWRGKFVARSVGDGDTVIYAVFDTPYLDSTTSRPKYGYH